MRRRGRVLMHVTLLVALVSGAASGVVMLVGYLVMFADAALGHMPVADMSGAQVAAGALMVALWGGAILAGLGALARQVRGCLRLARWVAAAGSVPSRRLAAAARSLPSSRPVPARSTSAGSMRGQRVVEIADDAPYAFTYGIWRPRIVVSSGLVAVTTDEELVAVLCHEDNHRHHRDPLKVLALRTWAAAFFLVPLVGALFRRVLERQELRADRAALRACGIPSVAGALLKAVGEPATAPGTALAAMGGAALLEARVTQLETGQEPPLLASVHTRNVWASLPGVALIAGYGVLMYQACMAVQLCCAH